MSVGNLLLTIAAILVYCGLLQRVLDRMYLTDRQALLMIAAMLIGTFLPSIRLGPVTIGIGGALIPLGICIFVLIRADKCMERYRSILGAVLSGFVIYVLSRLLPDEAESMMMEPIWLYGISSGLISWIVSKSRRGAFVGAVGGVLLADAANAMVMWVQGTGVELALGTAGIADTVVICGVMAVFTCELVGEATERLTRRATSKGGSSL